MDSLIICEGTNQADEVLSKRPFMLLSSIKEKIFMGLNIINSV